jgi:hypothetical protein
MHNDHKKPQVLGVHELLLLLFMLVFYGLPVYLAILVQV